VQLTPLSTHWAPRKKIKKGTIFFGHGVLLMMEANCVRNIYSYENQIKRKKKRLHLVGIYMTSITKMHGPMNIKQMSQRWIGRTGPKDLSLHSWPPRSPDKTTCDFFLWGYVKERVYVPPLPADLDELTNRIMAAVKSVIEDTLRGVWDEFSYRVDVVRAAGGGHIEHL